ncbi:DNA repair protein RecO [Thiolapillus brandeum]|uniref:DNA repair protein RecO n=1 Tax=Thiolapillus brandeum TaxID=1076588 RepID=A0A7U6GI38_9GAMM|nr:DNA repair protein RecO [Thiolapillus brandeum]BAO44059.1 DNA repair protein RecO [Thiolapillus brandeum]
MSAPESTPAFVLHARRYGESHLILDMLTLSAGRLSLMARGAASPRSVRRGILQPFVPLQVEWSGKGSIPNLRQVDARGAHARLLGSALFSGFYVNELTTRLLGEHEPVPDLFIAYESCLRELAQGVEPDAALRQYELSLLEVLGYGVELETEAGSGHPVRAEYRYTYETEYGVRKLQASDSLQVGGDTLLALSARQPLDSRQCQEARRLMRHVIGYYLGNRPLRSRELFHTQQIQERH